ncbi:tape measure protein [Permianibacter sp. IMCC34836]|uniref:tape measure protein n=1 Tax=Permianibacter fluminis TaxID=2738515 RepID=UPI0015555ECE|nr:tape measure protein [Permianibacter fluminis]NQD37479.1 tape measure protein [Permianibacter fluminis]
MTDVTIRLAADGSLLVSGMQQGENAVKRFTATAQSSVDATSSSFKQLQSDVGLVARAWAVITAGKFAAGLFSQAAAAEQTQIRLQNLSGSADAYARNQAYLSQLATRYGQDLQTLSGSYVRVLALEEARIVSGQQGREILEGMANASAFLGASQAQTAQSMFGLSQALTSGTVRAEELNQVTEPLPGLLQKLDKASGQTAGGFRRMVVDGKVTSDMFRDTLIRALSEYDGAAEKAAKSTQGSLNLMGNAVTSLQLAFTQATGGPLSVFAEGFANIASVMASPGMVPLIQGTLAAGIALVSVRTLQAADAAIGRVVAARLEAAANVDAARAAMAMAAANVEAAKTEYALAAAEANTARAAAAATPGFFLNAAAVEALREAEANELAMKAAVSVAENKEIGTKGVLNAATHRLAQANNVLGKATAFLGGPFGIAIAALAFIAPLLFQTASANDAAAAATDRNAAATARLAAQEQNLLDKRLGAVKSESLSAAQAEARLRTAERMLITAEKGLQLSVASNGARSEEAKQAQQLVTYWRGLIAVYEEARQKTPAAAEANKNLAQFNKELQERINTLGLTGVALDAYKLTQLAANATDKTALNDGQRLVQLYRDKEAAIQAENEAKKRAEEIEQRAKSLNTQLIQTFQQRMALDKQHATNVQALKIYYAGNAAQLDLLLKLEQQDYDMKVKLLDPHQQLLKNLEDEEKTLRDQVNARQGANREGFIALQLAKAGTDADAAERDAIRQKAGAIYDLTQALRQQQREDEQRRSTLDTIREAGGAPDSEALGGINLPEFSASEQLAQDHAVQLAMLDEFYQAKQTKLAESLEQGRLTQQEYQEQALLVASEYGTQFLALQQIHADEENTLNAQRSAMAIWWEQLTARQKIQVGIGALTQITAQLANHSRKAFEINKAAGLANAIVGTYSGVAMALENPWPLNLIAAASVLATGIMQIKQIKSAKFGGGGGGGGGSISTGGGAAAVTAATNSAPQLPQVIGTSTVIGGAPNGGTTINVTVGDVHGDGMTASELDSQMTKVVHREIVPAFADAVARDAMPVQSTSRFARDIRGDK